MSSTFRRGSSQSSTLFRSVLISAGPNTCIFQRLAIRCQRPNEAANACSRLKPSCTQLQSRNCLARLQITQAWGSAHPILCVSNSVQV